MNPLSILVALCLLISLKDICPDILSCQIWTRPFETFLKDLIKTSFVALPKNGLRINQGKMNEPIWKRRENHLIWPKGQSSVVSDLDVRGFKGTFGTSEEASISEICVLIREVAKKKGGKKLLLSTPLNLHRMHLCAFIILHSYLIVAKKTNENQGKSEHPERDFDDELRRFRQGPSSSIAQSIRHLFLRPGTED